MGRARLPLFFGGDESPRHRSRSRPQHNRERATYFLVAVAALALIGLAFSYLRVLSAHGKRVFEVFRYNYWFSPPPFRSPLLPPSDKWLSYRLGDAVIGRGDLQKRIKRAVITIVTDTFRKFRRSNT